VPQATKKLKDAGFEVKTKNRFSRDVPKGAAAGTDPEAGVQVRRGTTVTLFVSKGTNQVKVPSVVGLSRNSARQTLKDAGLIPEIAERDDPAQAGQVLEQDPGAGTLVDKKSTVTITISTGHFQVKDVVGLTQSKATKTLRNQGLSVSVVQQPTNKQSQDGKVISQDPPDGATVRKGDVVTITVGVFGP
jgi:serine/threonine-protein kinase